MDVNDSEEIESEEEEDRMNMDEQEDLNTAAANKNVGPSNKRVAKETPADDDDDDDDEKEVPGAYNPQ